MLHLCQGPGVPTNGHEWDLSQHSGNRSREGSDVGGHCPGAPGKVSSDLRGLSRSLGIRMVCLTAYVDSYAFLSTLSAIAMCQYLS